MGSLAGSSGVAYQTTHRSPLSYNTNKSSPMTTRLPFGKFERGGGGGGVEKANAREVMEEHNANAGSFYKEPVSMSSSSASAAPPMESSLYDELIQRLSALMAARDGSGEDKSDIRGDTLSQTYYYGITAIMLYLLYRTLYRKNRK